ncbi:MAG: hypothetical protein GY795_14480 [Desulfobacterales bacterium]|nr:hypothetical protein [Desulfobacterales bacterium]
MLSFKECTLAKLEKTFSLEQIRTSPVLEDWLTGQAEISDFERQVLTTYREHLLINVYDWNETELAFNFIGPVISLVNYTTKKFNFFAERLFKGTVDGIEMGGKPDGMIASGFREPEKPYFCFQEYKKNKDPEGDPAAQALAAMLTAQELNEHQHPVYGCYIIGRDWCFMILDGRQYAVTEPYIATRDDLFDIFRILRVLKKIIIRLAEKETELSQEEPVE